MKRVAWRRTLPYVKSVASGNLLYDAGSSNPVLCDSLDAVTGEGSRSREHVYTNG